MANPNPREAYNAARVNRTKTRGRQKKRWDTEGAKARFIELMYEGSLIQPACDKIGYARKTYEMWRKDDPGFKEKVDIARQLRQADRGDDVARGERLGFAEWREKYLRVTTPWHQLQWVDMIEGREPRDLHPSQQYIRGISDNRLLINCPPFHGKSIALTVDYSCFRLVMDPSYRILIISAGSDLAAQFLYGIKERMTSPDFIELQKAYAPEGGWEATAESWTETRIIFGTDVRADGARETHEKDPNVQIAGMGSKIYGRRADMIFVDDGVDETNVSAYAKQQNWLNRTVLSRLELGGKIVIVGTRIAPVDLYSELMKPENYANLRVPWTHLASPAILEEGETPAQHKTLWPYADVPWVQRDPSGKLMDRCICGRDECADGLDINGRKQYQRWDGIHLEKGPRADNSETMWALVYQQKSVSENATFPEHAVAKSTNSLRFAGRLENNKVGHPVAGMNGLYVIAGCDPSIKGFAGIVVEALDKDTDKRYLLDARNMRAPTPEALKSMMKALTEQYHINEWRVEKTGLLQFFTQDVGLRTYFQARGVRFTEHHTGSNKWDYAFGVASMASLFGEYDKPWDDPKGGWREITPPLIELPRPHQEALRALVHQLITWTPDLDPGKVPCDLVMALWFAEIGAREYLGTGRSGNVVQFGRSNKFVSPRQRRNTTKVNLADFRTGI